ncbi:MAG: glutamine synthetase family protein [Actinomycetota bacterium]
MTVAADAERGALAKEAAGSLRDQGVTAVALGFVDPSAIVRVKCVPLARFPQAVTSGVGLSTLFNVAMSNDHFALHPGYIDGPSGDLRLRADPAATVAMAAMPGWAWAPIDQYTQHGEPFPGCPRGFLHRMVDRLDALGLKVAAAYEFEFSVGTASGDDGFEPAHEGPGYSDIALVANHEFGLDLIQTIEAQGLDLQQFHPEYAEGQFEISIAPREPVAAADVSILVRETVRAVAKRHGWKTSFSPRVLSDTGNGAHLHVSLWDGDRNLVAGGSGPAGMEQRGEAFMAGILRELPALVAITAPSCVSYLRLQPQHWSGAMRCWGTENREASLRFIVGTTVETAASANMEIKPVDGTANAYLALGAVLAAGIAGIVDDERLPPSTEEDPLLLSPAEQDARGIRQLPASLPEAADQLAESSVLREAMGDFLFETFLATRRGEAKQYEGLDDDQLIRALRWRF